MELMHSPTGTTLYVAVYWVTFAAAISFVLAGLILVPLYLWPLLRRLYRRLLGRASPTSDKRSL